MTLSLVLAIVEAAVYHDGRYLMIVRGYDEEVAPGALAFPGGKVDFAEIQDILELTAERELLEETGVQIIDSQYVESHAFSTSDGTPILSIVYISRYASGTPTISDPGEVADIRWMSAAEITSDPATPDWMFPSLELVERKRIALGW